MRNYIDLVSGKKQKLNEDEKPTKTKSSFADFAFADDKSKGDLTAPSSSSVPASDDSTPPTPTMGKTASKSKTRASIKSFNDPRAGQWLSNLSNSELGLDDEIDDDEAAMRAGETDAIDTDGYSEPRTPENLPAVISTAVSQSGQDFDPEWHMVRNLPGYMQKPIRALGRMIFSPFTDTPLDDIQVLSTLSNDETEVKMMAAWIMKNGIRDDQAEMDFSQIMPSYKSQTQIWSTEGYQFMIVKDFAGHYIYGWPGGRGVHVGADKAPKQLR